MANKGYTDTKRRCTGHTKGQTLLKILVAMFTIIMVIAAGYAAVNYVKGLGQVESPPSYHDEPIDEPIDELAKKERFLEKYYLANFNEDAKTIRVSGKISAAGKEQTFTLTKKRPNLMRLKIKNPPLEVTIGVNGEQVWRKIRVPTQPDTITMIEGEEAAPWIEQGRFYDNIISASQGLGEIKSIVKSDYNSKTYLKVSIMNANDKYVDILVDPKTLHPFAEFKTTKAGNQTTLMSDFRDVDGMRLPFKIETHLNGELSQTTTITAVTINTGVLSDFFNVPTEIFGE